MENRLSFVFLDKIERMDTQHPQAHINGTGSLLVIFCFLVSFALDVFVDSIAAF